MNNGARFYAPATGRFTGVDPAADLTPCWSAYSYKQNNPLMYTDPSGENLMALFSKAAVACPWAKTGNSLQAIGQILNAGSALYNGVAGYNNLFNNPINFIDPDGRMAVPPSTHTDEQGNVIATYDDGDDGVYVHSNGTTKSQIDQQRIDNENTGVTGANIGEIGGTIDANTIYTNTLRNNIDEAKGILNPFTFKSNVRNGGKWDLKNNKSTIYGLANDGKTQFLIEGILMESQDIGNHHFGAVGKAYGFFPETFMLQQAGQAQISAGTSKPEWQVYKNVRKSNFTKTGRHYFTTERVMQPPYGDDPRDQKWIKSGFQYFKDNR